MHSLLSSLFTLVLICASLGAARAQGPPRSPDAPARQTRPVREDAGREIDEDEVVRVSTDVVTVPASVLDRDGRYVTDLRREDFRIYENGVEQPITHFNNVEQPFSVILLVDTSESTAPHLDRIKQAALAFLDHLRANDLVQIISFDGDIRALLPEPTNNPRLLSAAINGLMPADGSRGTRLYDAVEYAFDSLKIIPGRKAVFLFTDGGDTWSKASDESTLARATELDALVYTVYYGLPPTTKYLRRLADMSTKYLGSLASRTGGRFYQAAGDVTLEQTFTAVSGDLRRQYSIGYYPSDREARERRIRVRVNRPGVAVRARRSYNYAARGENR